VDLVHRREDFYGADALEFKPERWETLRPGWEYLPFNGGPRICVGQQYALMEASYATIRLMQTFSRIESRDDQDWREWICITLASKNGTKVALFEK
jgi:cytochrome P450